MNEQDHNSSEVTVSEMARMVGLSRSRFYQLVNAGVFPWPVYGLFDRRARYVTSLQLLCLQVRKQNCGLNGKPVMFYARRVASSSTPELKARSTEALKRRANRIGGGTKSDRQGTIFLAVFELGLHVTPQQVNAVVKQEYPKGIVGITEAEVIRKVFLSLKRQNSGDSVGR